MRKLVAFLLISCVAFGQGRGSILRPISRPRSGVAGGAGGGGTVKCGYSPTTPASSDNNLQTPEATPCTTGANVNGYSVASISWYSQATSTTDTYDVGIYASTGSGASLAPTGNPICHTGGFTPTVAAGYNTKVIAGCGTLSASTSYFIAYISHDGTAYGYDAGNCPGFSIPMIAGPGQSATPATLPSPYGTTSSFGECLAIYATLNVL